MTYESLPTSSKRRSLIAVAVAGAAMSLGVLVPSQSARADAFGTFQLTPRTSPSVADSFYLQDLYAVEAGVEVMVPGFDFPDQNLFSFSGSDSVLNASSLNAELPDQNLFSFSGSDDGMINAGSLSSIEVVPEPASLALLAGCSAGLLARRRSPRSA